MKLFWRCSYLPHGTRYALSVEAKYLCIIVCSGRLLQIPSLRDNRPFFKLPTEGVLLLDLVPSTLLPRLAECDT